LQLWILKNMKKNQATIKLLENLIKAENSIKSDNDWLDEYQVKEKLKIELNY